MINIGEIRKEIKGGRVRIVSDISMEDKVIPLFFETEEENSKYLCEESGDAFLLGVLLYAMKKHEDIHVEPPVSERLLYGITQILMPALIIMNPNLGIINIIPEQTHIKSLNIFKGVATPLSCGVDSFYTAISNIKNDLPISMRLTHFLLFNPNSYGKEKESSQAEFFLQINKIQPVCNQLGIPLVWINSNLVQFIPFEFEKIHTFCNVSCALALQKLINIFYYASGHSLKYFSMNFSDTSYYDLLNENALKTEGFEMISFGKLISRFNKTKEIDKNPICHKYLNVCVKPKKARKEFNKINCSSCFKCIRTMVALDILGRLHNYESVFDLATFHKNRSKYWGRIRHIGWRAGDEFASELLEAAKENGYKIPFSSFFWMAAIAVRNRINKAGRATGLCQRQK